MIAADERSQRVLRERAEKLARRQRSVAQAPERQLVCVQAGNSRFAFPVESVDEVTSLNALARYPAMPAWLYGVGLHRGQSVSLLDLGALMGGTSASNARVAVMLTTSSGPLAVVADELLGLISISDERLSVGLEAEFEQYPFIESITRDLTQLVDPEELAREKRVCGQPK